jgi:hypothetical protein
MTVLRQAFVVQGRTNSWRLARILRALAIEDRDFESRLLTEFQSAVMNL